MLTEANHFKIALDCAEILGQLLQLAKGFSDEQQSAAGLFGQRVWDNLKDVPEPDVQFIRVWLGELLSVAEDPQIDDVILRKLLDSSRLGAILFDYKDLDARKHALRLLKRSQN